MPPRILLVEDDLASRDAMSALLRDFAFDVECAADGAEALRAARTTPPDAILLDLVMPVMTGFEFLARRGEDARLAATPVVLMTSHTPVGMAVRGVRVPAGIPILVKPFAPEDLVSTLRRAVRARGTGPGR